MIVNQSINFSVNSNRPVREQNDKTKTDQNQGGMRGENVTFSSVEDSVELNAQRLIVSENLSASEAVVPDQAIVGDLLNMLKLQLEQNPADAVGAQTSNLGAAAAKLLDNI